MATSAQKILVTGGTSGLGLAMAAALTAAGARVALTGRSRERAASVAASLPGAVGIAMDVRDESSVANAVDEAWSRLGSIDMLVNNAGLSPSAAAASSTSRSATRRCTGPGSSPTGRPGPAARRCPGSWPPTCGTLRPEVMGPPIVWLASAEAAGTHDERIIAAEFDSWLAGRDSRQ